MTGHSATTHKRIRKMQNLNVDEYHHPKEKIKQLKKFESYLNQSDILEVFGGKGNLTKFYQQYGKVTAMTKENNSFDWIYRLRGEKKKYDVIDIDSYGYPDKFFPVAFEMMKDKCLLVFTFPIVGVNCLNGITEQHFLTFWKSARPSIGDITGILTDMALREWRMLSLLDVTKIKRIWRFVFVCTRVKATNMCNVRNKYLLKEIKKHKQPLLSDWL